MMKRQRVSSHKMKSNVCLNSKYLQHGPEKPKANRGKLERIEVIKMKYLFVTDTSHTYESLMQLFRKKLKRQLLISYCK